MTRLARILLAALLLPVASCGFNDTQKAAFVRRVTNAILSAAGSSSVVLVHNAVAATPAKAVTVPAPLVCEKAATRLKCPKAHASRKAAPARPLFEPEFIPLEVQMAKLRHSSLREAAARVRCEMASLREERRHFDEEKRIILRTHFATTSDALTPLPPIIFSDSADEDQIVVETIGG